MDPAHDDIQLGALRARAEADADAIRGRAEVDARALRAGAEADAAATLGRAEVEAAALLRAAQADREDARRALLAAHAEADALLAEAAEARRQAEQRTLDRLLATRSDLHDAIERLTEVTEPVLDLTDRSLALAPVGADPDVPLVHLDAALESAVVDPSGSGSGHGTDDTGSAAEADPSPPAEALDPIEAMVRSALGRAADSASQPGRTQAFATEEPARRREQLRNGRDVL